MPNCVFKTITRVPNFQLIFGLELTVVDPAKFFRGGGGGGGGAGRAAKHIEPSDGHYGRGEGGRGGAEPPPQ